MKRNILKKSKGFTLIELLIVIGILAVLAVTLLLALNPAEAQKRTRDTRRIRDMATLQAIINQYLESGRDLTGSCLLAGCDSNVHGPAGTAPQGCAVTNNWLSTDVCAYAQAVPVDPNNRQTRTFVTAGAGNTVTANAAYVAKVVGSNYEINTLLEAEANRVLITTDGGADGSWYEVYSGPATIFLP